MARATQISCSGRQGPAPAVDPDFCAYFFKLPVAEIVEQIFPPAILGILKALGHDARCGEMPQINVFGIVAPNKKIQESVAVVIEPDGCVRVDPGRQSGLLGYARKAAALIIVKQLGSSP